MTDLGPDAFAAGVRTFSRIGDCWQLKREQRARLLGLADGVEFDHVLAAPERYCTDERLQRMSLVFGIWKALGTLLPDQRQADTWLSRSNTTAPFGGRPAQDLMTTGRIEDLRAVHQYLMSKIT